MNFKLKLSWRQPALLLFGTLQIALITAEAWASAHELPVLTAVLSGLIAACFLGFVKLSSKAGVWGNVMYVGGCALGGWLGPVLMPLICN